MDKKKFALIGILVIIAVVAYLYFNQGPGEPEKNVEYKNEQFGFSLAMDEEFQENVLIEAGQNAVYFISREIQAEDPDGHLGRIGRIEVYNKGEYSQTTMLEAGDAYSLRYLGENEIYLFGWAHATDVQVPPGDKNRIKNFRKLEQDFEEVITSFQTFSPPQEQIPQNRTDTGIYVGLADNNFFEVKINDGYARVFMISDRVRNHFDSLDLQGGEEVKIEYYENQYGQNVVQGIEIITP